MIRFLWFFILVSLCGAAQAIELLASIKPVQLLVASISAGVSQPQLLIPSSSSPHDYALRPSERRRLDQADIVFWIGPELEVSLPKILRQLPAKTQVVALSTSADTDHAKHQGKTHDHEQGHADPHIWLDPEMAADIATRIANILSQADPAHHSAYQHNLQRFLEKLALLDAQLKARLEPVNNQGYFVFHDAYQGFEKHYQLNHLGAFTLNPERPPGARHLAGIRQQLLDKKAVCVFSEPQFPPTLVSNLVEGSGVRQAQLDPLGVDIEADAEGYLRLLTQLAETFERCLSKSQIEH